MKKIIIGIIAFTIILSIYFNFNFKIQKDYIKDGSGNYIGISIVNKKTKKTIFYTNKINKKNGKPIGNITY